jgi:low temperature requirement protein LtrA
MSDIDRTEVLFEEAFVLAIERFSHLPDMTAYNRAQNLLVTALHPVWLADEVIKNWNRSYWTPTKSKFYKKYTEIKNNNKL